MDRKSIFLLTRESISYGGGAPDFVLAVRRPVAEGPAELEPLAYITGAELSRWLGLTRQQGNIAAFIAARFTNQEIAQGLGIAPSTVKTHAEMVFARLNVTKREQLKRCLLDMLMESVLSRRG